MDFNVNGKESDAYDGCEANNSSPILTVPFGIVYCLPFNPDG